MQILLGSAYSMQQPCGLHVQEPIRNIEENYIGIRKLLYKEKK
jgi:hypothetical protein